MATPYIKRGKFGLTYGHLRGYVATESCFLLLFLFEHEPQMDLIGANSHTGTENVPPLLRQKELIVMGSLI